MPLYMTGRRKGRWSLRRTPISRPRVGRPRVWWHRHDLCSHRNSRDVFRARRSTDGSVLWCRRMLCWYNPRWRFRNPFIRFVEHSLLGGTQRSRTSNAFGCGGQLYQSTCPRRSGCSLSWSHVVKSGHVGFVAIMCPNPRELTTLAAARNGKQSSHNERSRRNSPAQQYV